MIQIHLLSVQNTMHDVYEHIADYTPNKEKKILILFDDMTADIMINEKFKNNHNHN